jgi:hypothetical protein
MFSHEGFKMDNKTILASLNKIADSLEVSGFYKEADDITNVMKKVAQMVGPAKGDTSRDLNWKWIQSIQSTPQYQNAMAQPDSMRALLNSGLPIPGNLDQMKIAIYINQLKKDPNFVPGA